MNALLRRIGVILLISVLIVAVVLGFFWLRVRYSSSLETKEAIPENFVLCLETKNYGRLSSALQNHSNIWDEFLDYNVLADIDTLIHEIDSLGRSLSNVKSILEGQVLISIYPDEEKHSLLIACSSPENKATEQLLKLISNETLIQKEGFENLTLYHLDFKDAFPGKLSFFEHRGILLMSPSISILKNAGLHINEGKNTFTSDKYKRITSTLGEDVEAHIYVNFELLEGLASSVISPEELPELSAFSSVAALDLEIKPDQFILNGFSESVDTIETFLSVFSGQDPVEQRLFPVIPSNVSYFKWLGVSNTDLLRNKVRGTAVDTDLQNLRNGFFEHFSGQVAELILKENSLDFPEYLIISVKSRGQADDFLRNSLKELNGNSELEIEKVKVDDNYQLEAIKLPVRDIENVLVGDLVRNKNYQWYCFVENNLLLGNTLNDLQEFSYLNQLGRTLENDDYFQELKENFSSRSNFFIYFDPSQYYSEILKILNPEAAAYAEKRVDSWKKFDVAGFQSTVTEDMNYFRLFLNYSGQIRELVNTVWERKLDSKVSIKPHIVVNHITGEKEIFIQDESNNIYLISNTGSILWKQKIDGQILSEVFQIDFYKNKRLQYLFNTESRIYLIDRNGNSVEDYPVVLRQKASAGISLFDYDNNRRYRIPVPTTENDILMYDINGKIVSGWRFRSSDHTINSPVLHTRVGGKDYIIAKDAFRLYLLDRRGRIREKPSRQIDFSVHNNVFYLRAGGGKAERLVASDKTGDIYEFFFDGKVNKLLDIDMSEDHFFMPSDLNGDGKPEFIFADYVDLKVYNSSGDLVFSEVYPEAITERPYIYTFSFADKKIGIVVSESERIYLVNNDGSLYKGFPLKGSSLFSISSFPGLEDRFNLIVGNNDNFLYNYSVK